MKTLLACNQCVVNGIPSYTKAEIEANGIYEFTCTKGHRNISILQLHSFQVLYDLGISALLDGYTREAVSSLAVSIERFYEYCMDILLYELSKDEKEQTWKLVSKQSERQLGAFYYLYLSKMKKTPPFVSNKWIEFRNNVIHKGEIPKAIKTLEYAKYVFQYIIEILISIKEKYTDINYYYRYLTNRMLEVNKRMDDVNKRENVLYKSTIGTMSFIETQYPIQELKNFSFESRMEFFKAKRENDIVNGEFGDNRIL